MKLVGGARAESQGRIRPEHLQKTLEMYDKEGKTVNIGLSALIRANGKYLKKKVFKPYLKMLCMRLILFYQRRISKHTCLYRQPVPNIRWNASTITGHSSGYCSARGGFCAAIPFPRAVTTPPPKSISKSAGYCDGKMYFCCVEEML